MNLLYKTKLKKSAALTFLISSKTFLIGLINTKPQIVVRCVYVT